MQVNRLSLILFFLVVTLFFFSFLNYSKYGLAGFNGYSMCPSKGLWGLTIVQNTSNYQIGDIVTFSKGESNVNHRIVGTTTTQFIIAGDYKNIWRERGWSTGSEFYDFIPKENILFKDVFNIDFIGCPNFYNMTLEEVDELHWIYEGFFNMTRGLILYGR